MIFSGANCGRGIGEIVNRRATYLGASTTTQTLHGTGKPNNNAMIDTVTKTLRHKHKTVWMLDNSQCGHQLKSQSPGSSNNFVKAMGRASRIYALCETDEDEIERDCIKAAG